MNIELTDKDIKELGYLRRCLNSKMVPVENLESFLNGLQHKIASTAAPKIRKVKDDSRSDRYRMKVIGGGNFSKKQSAI